jgi:hypothetical protein
MYHTIKETAELYPSNVNKEDGLYLSLSSTPRMNTGSLLWRRCPLFSNQPTRAQWNCSFLGLLPLSS